MYSIFLVLVAIMFIVIAILIRVFKCYWLIAMYNTASKEVQEKTDIIGMSKFIGKYLIIMSIILIISFIVSVLNLKIISYLVLTPILPILFYVAIGTQKFGEFTKNTKLIKRVIVAIFTLILIISILVFALIFYGIQEAEVLIEDKVFTIDCMYGTKIDFKDVSSITLSHLTPKYEKKTYGFNYGEILKGDFIVNNEKAKLYVNQKSEKFINIVNKSGSIIISYKDDSKTEKLYQELINQWEKNKNN